MNRALTMIKRAILMEGTEPEPKPATETTHEQTPATSQSATRRRTGTARRIIVILYLVAPALAGSAW